MDAKQTAIYEARLALSNARFVAASEVPDPHGPKMVGKLNKVHDLVEAAFKALYEGYEGSQSEQL